MPEISRFLGIAINMYFNEHDPPHFHAQYNEYRGVVHIKELRLLEGKLPKRVLALVLEWAHEHRNELMKNWESLRLTGEYKKIKPLI